MSARDTIVDALISAGPEAWPGVQADSIADKLTAAGYTSVGPADMEKAVDVAHNEYWFGHNGGDKTRLDAMRRALTAAAPHMPVPDGWVLVPVKETEEMAYAAACAHYGKRRVAASGGIDGISMTVNGLDHSFRRAFKRFWKGALAAAPKGEA